jgi:hypothetical protein
LAVPGCLLTAGSFFIQLASVCGRIEMRHRKKNFLQAQNFLLLLL